MFGIELEFSEQYDSVKKVISTIIPKNKLKIDDRSGVKSDGTVWHLKKDSTTCCEIASPKLKTFNRELRKIVDASREFAVTEKDSVHVHVSAHRVDFDKLFAYWILYEPMIRKLFPKHRRDNTYCKLFIKKQNRKKLFKNVAYYFKESEEIRYDHHTCMNYYSHDLKHKTIEFRMMEGNTEFNDIYNWVRFVQSLVQASQIMNITNVLIDTPRYDDFDFEFLDSDIQKWADERIERFSKK